MNHTFRLLTIFLILSFLIAGLSGCFRPLSTEPPEASNTIPVEKTEPTEQERGPSGTLRLWWDLTLPENPLEVDSESSQAIYSMVFGQLFRLDANWQIQPELVSDYSYSAERLQLTLALNPDNRFHDGSSLTASDVRATLDEIQTVGESSPYYANLAAYSSCRIINSTTLVLQLAYADPRFLYALDFPVLKASEVALPAGSMWQGTLTYRMDQLTDEGLQLTLAKPVSEQNGLLSSILVKSYRSATEAMRGLEDDELDLVYLPTDDLYLYQMRSSLQLDRFNSHSFTFFTFGNNLSSETDRMLFRYYLRPSLWALSGKPWPGQTSDVPIPANHACFSGQPLDLESSWPEFLTQNGLSLDGILSDQDLFANFTRPVRIIVPDDPIYLQDMAVQAETWLTQAGLTVDMQILDPGQFAVERLAGDYSLAFQTADFEASSEPGWFLENASARTEGLPDTNDYRYDESQSALASGWPFFSFLGYSLPSDQEALANLARNYRQIISNALLAAPQGGILLGEAGIAYGDRVIGQCQPTDAQPYWGVEELWIWSGS